ncbi:hypothetical protein ACFLY6_00125 [Candidatus Dependentiae bacterium]
MYNTITPPPPKIGFNITVDGIDFSCQGNQKREWDVFENEVKRKPTYKELLLITEKCISLSKAHKYYRIFTPKLPISFHGNPFVHLGFKPPKPKPKPKPKQEPADDDTDKAPLENVTLGSLKSPYALLTASGILIPVGTLIYYIIKSKNKGMGDKIKQALGKLVKNKIALLSSLTLLTVGIGSKCLNGVFSDEGLCNTVFDFMNTPLGSSKKSEVGRLEEFEDLYPEITTGPIGGGLHDDSDNSRLLHGEENTEYADQS